MTFKFCTSRDPDDYDYMFLQNTSTWETVARIRKVDLALALGATGHHDCGCERCQSEHLEVSCKA